MVVDIIKPPTIDANVVDHPKNAYTASNHACRVQKLNRSIEYTRPPTAPISLCASNMMLKLNNYDILAAPSIPI